MNPADPVIRLHSPYAEGATSTIYNTKDRDQEDSLKIFNIQARLTELAMIEEQLVNNPLN